MEHRHNIRPVQLFMPSSSNPNTLRLNKSALNAVLGHASIANRKLVVISVSGANRKGKSFLLNFFLEYLYMLQYMKNDVNIDWLQDETQLEGFHYRPGPKKDTVGIWLWAEPIMIERANGERLAVLLMDTQGCFEQSAANHPHGNISSSVSQQQFSLPATNPLLAAGNTALPSPSPMAPSPTQPQLSSIHQATMKLDNGEEGGQPGSSSSSAGAGQTAVGGVSDAVLALSTMLSSAQMFCVSEHIPEETFHLLRFFTDYARLARTEALSLGGSHPFQRLSLVVRDAKLSDSPDTVYGVEGGKRLLERTLVPPAEHQHSMLMATAVTAVMQQRRRSSATGGLGVPGSSAGGVIPLLNDPASQRQRALVKEELAECFELSCYLLPSPGPKVTEGSAFRGLIKDVKPLFRDEVRRLVECTLAPDLIKPKTLNGKEMTVRKFVECVKEYAKLFEAREVPDSRSVLNANLQLACMDYALEAKHAYCRGMDRVTRSSRMMAEKRLLEAHIRNGIKALNIYDRCPKIDSGEVRSRNLAALQEAINRELERYKKLNEEKRVTTCASAMLACGDSPLFGLGLGGATSVLGAVAATVVSLQMGLVTAGIVAIPVSLGALLGIWLYVTLKPPMRVCLGMERD